MSKKELFEIFQQCFGRLLTPFEIEDINKWIDEDDMPVEVVNAALKEAVTNNKISWKYVNNILAIIVNLENDFQKLKEWL